MNTLTKHQLDFHKSLPYFEKHVKNLSTLSKELAKSVEFISGSFFTFLPLHCNTEQIYKFKEGGILPQNPKIPFSETENRGSYQIIPNLRTEIAQAIFQKIKTAHLIAIFEDFVSSTKDPFRNFNGLQRMTRRYNEEIYYVAKSSNTENQILECLYQANAIWHSLCVLTKVNLRDPNEEELTLEDLQEASRNAEMIIVGAYDGEGYVFWERNR